jgi:hypothetical protein
MKFRKIYWVTEFLDKDGAAKLSGVYTSVADLISRGVAPRSGVEPPSGLRLSLVQLDSTRPPLGSWSSPGFPGLEESLEEYIGTGELTYSECESLRTALDSLRLD